MVNYVREYQLDHGVPKAQVYSITMYILAGLLAIGFVCNLLIRPVDKKYYMTPAQLAALDDPKDATVASRAADGGAAHASANLHWLVYAAWVPVVIPLLWGVWVTLQKAALMFGRG